MTEDLEKRVDAPRVDLQRSWMGDARNEKAPFPAPSLTPRGWTRTSPPVNSRARVARAVQATGPADRIATRCREFRTTGERQSGRAGLLVPFSLPLGDGWVAGSANQRRSSVSVAR